MNTAVLSFTSTEVTCIIDGVLKTFTKGQTYSGKRAGRFAVLGFRQLPLAAIISADVIESVIVDCKAVGPNGELGRGKCLMTLDSFA